MNYVRVSADPTGYCVWLPVPKTAVASIHKALGGRIPSEELATAHVTVLYMPAVTAGELTRLVPAFEKVCRETPPLVVDITGIGSFSAGDKDQVPIVLLASIPGASLLYERVLEAVDYAGVSVDTPYGFIPHVTLTYADSPDYFLQRLPTIQWTARSMELVCKDTVRTRFPLLG